MSILELKITLLDTKPSVYRTIHIEKTRSFYDLHVAIQLAFGWQNYHLYEFRINEDIIGENEFDGETDVLESSDILLSQKIVFEKQKFFYTYDFGDNWEHQIELVKFIEPKKTFYPQCVKGAKNAPPEDCGGVWGFEAFKAIMKDKKHPQYKEMKEWNDGIYDEDFFSLALVNKAFESFDATLKEFKEHDEDTM